jgi:hypothetical protein
MFSGVTPARIEPLDAVFVCVHTAKQSNLNAKGKQS